MNACPRAVVASVLLVFPVGVFSDIPIGDVPALLDSFGLNEDRAAARLIDHLAGADSALAYASLDRGGKAPYLKGFWRRHNPLVWKYYYGYHVGRRRYSVSDAFFETLGRVPAGYQSRFPPPDSARVEQAARICERLVSLSPDDPVALCALGYLRLEQGRAACADSLFLTALKQRRGFAEARNGRGLALLAKPKQGSRARKLLQAAIATDRNYQAAYYSLAMAHLVTRSIDLAYHFNKVAKRFPAHHDVHFKLGVVHQKTDLKKAAEAYTRQIEVNPGHDAARFNLGTVLLGSGRAEEAIRIWTRLIETRPDFGVRAMPLLLEAYQTARRTIDALRVASEYIGTLDADTQALFRDIRLIASRSELLEYEKLPPAEQPRYELTFWRKRDPTPATRANERLVEHYRRVLYATRNFSGRRKPWDRRGEIYIRYGEPAHRSRSGAVRFEIDPRVVRVKERLLMQIPPAGRREILARISRIRTSTRDVSARDAGGLNVEVADFESIDFELNPLRGGFTVEAEQVDISGRREGHDYGDQPATHREKATVDNIRGYPLFPVDGDKPWEYWIYPGVGMGIEVVFTALSYGGAFDYPVITSGRALALYNASLWVQRQPENVVVTAVSKQGDLFRTARPSLDFYFDTADFRGDTADVRGGRGRTRLEVYYGVPAAGLSGTDNGTGQLKRGISLFDTDWKPLLQKVSPLPYRVEKNPEPGTIIIDQVVLNLQPGRYYLGVQVEDPVTGRIGVYKQELVVKAYDVDSLMISDVEFAGRVIEDATQTQKGGLNVIPLPSRAYGSSQNVLVYYEVYGLTPDEFGQTHYRVDYRIAPHSGGRPVVKILRAVGRLLGQEQGEFVTISFEQTGESESESSYLEVDVSGPAGGQHDLEISVTDLVSGSTATKEATFWISR